MTYLITGATGNVGRRVVEQLVREGLPVRALTRRPDAANLAPGVQVVGGDLAKPDTYRAALEGVTRLYMFPLAATGTDPFALSDMLVTTDLPRLAKDAGVERIVLLSSNAVLYGQDPHHQAAEEAVLASGIDYTLLRPGEFALNKRFTWGESIKTAGVVRSGFAEVKGVPVHEADIAAVAVEALVRDGHAGAKYEITGPAALTIREQVDAIATGLGRPIRFEALTPDEARQDWMDQGMPSELVDELMDHYKQFEAEPPQASPAVQEVTRRPAHTLTQWAADHVDDFR